MSILTANKLGKFYGADEIFSDITIAIPADARIALVGPNGAGQDYLDQHPRGHRSAHRRASQRRSRHACILSCRSARNLAGDHSLWCEQLKAFDDLRAMEARLTELERQMAGC